MRVELIDIFIENMEEAHKGKKFLEQFQVIALPEKALFQLYPKGNLSLQCAFKELVIQIFLTHG